MPTNSNNLSIDDGSIFVSRQRRAMLMEPDPTFGENVSNKKGFKEYLPIILIISASLVGAGLLLYFLRRSH